MNILAENFRTHQSENLPKLCRITNADLGFLHQILSDNQREDGYSLSAAYYAMTGRKGLWLYSNDHTFMLMAAHPNRDNHLLLFPPVGNAPAQLIKHVVRDRRVQSDQIQLARMSNQDHLLLAWSEATGEFVIKPEGVLDWAYPVHTLSTAKLAKHEGHVFKDFRKNIGRALRRNSDLTLVSKPSDRHIMLEITNAWANSSVHDGYSKNDLIMPTRKIVSLMENSDLPLNAIITWESGQPVGFIVWEETSSKRAFANSVSGISTGGKGASEFLYYAMTTTLAERGYEQVCIGGSETEGLDQFKRKMNPIASIPLQSAFSCSP